MGLLFIAIGPAMFALVRMDPQSRPTTREDLLAFKVMSVVYPVLGLLVLTTGILNIIAGIRVLNFRGRTFAIVALFSNVLPVFSCYCALTGIGLMIYGLVVMFNNEVARAFVLADEGMSPKRIMRRFNRRAARDRYEEEDDEDWE